MFIAIVTDSNNHFDQQSVVYAPRWELIPHSTTSYAFPRRNLGRDIGDTNEIIIANSYQGKGLWLKITNPQILDNFDLHYIELIYTRLI